MNPIKAVALGALEVNNASAGPMKEPYLGCGESIHAGGKPGVSHPITLTRVSDSPAESTGEIGTFL